MKIPNKLKIGGHIFEVRLTDDIDDCGNTDVMGNVLRLNKKLPPDQQGATLLHEIMGACNTTMHDKQHELLDSLAEQMFQVLADNNMLR